MLDPQPTRIPQEPSPIVEDYEATLTEATEKIRGCEDVRALKAVEREYVGKKGIVAQLLASIPELEPAERPLRGKSANLLKQGVGQAVEVRGKELADAALQAERSGAGFDPTLPPPRVQRGSLHPLTQVTRELEDLFQSMGYQVLDGPEVELDYYNFEALNIPSDHPARDSHDTFFCDEQGQLVMRTHTSPVQVRAMERLEPPYRIVVPGKCFRQETTDASHDHTFHQMEGLVVDKDISVAHLIGAMKTLLRGIFARDLEVRLRPGFFPFVEPGFELDARCPFCETGCKVCKRTTWIELLPCGLVHPNVLRYGGLDPEEWGGFAFGLGLSRLVMLRYGIDDVRHLFGADLRFLGQF
jgi:phenylalanyl-tRNA synthetase alpha chain